MPDIDVDNEVIAGELVTAAVPLTITDSGAGDNALLLSDINLRLDRIEKTVEGLRDGVNTIGSMMNGVAEAFDQIMGQVQKGGIGALLGGFMGGNKNG